MAAHQADRRARRPASGRHSPLITTRLALQRICSSPAIHDSCSSLVIKTRSCSFVAGFTFVLMLVLVLLWKGWVMVDMVSLSLVFVCMAAMFGAPPLFVHVQITEIRT